MHSYPKDTIGDFIMELPACPVESALVRIGDKWKLLLLQDLMAAGGESCQAKQLR